MYHTMGRYRDPRPGAHASTPEDFLQARVYFEQVASQWPDTPEGQFAESAIKRLVAVWAVGVDTVGGGVERNPDLAGEVAQQVHGIVTAAKAGLAGNDEVPQALREEFLARLGRWLAMYLERPLPPEDVTVIQADLRWAPGGPGLRAPRSPGFYEWVITSTYRAERAIARYVASRDWSGPAATRQERRARQAEEARVVLDSFFAEAWPDAPAQVRQGWAVAFSRRLDLCVEHPLWGDLPLPLPEDTFAQVLLEVRGRFRPHGITPRPDRAESVVRQYERTLIASLDHALDKHLEVPEKVGSVEEIEFRRLSEVREAAHRRRVDLAGDETNSRWAFQDWLCGNEYLVHRDWAVFVLRPFWLQLPARLLTSRAAESDQTRRLKEDE